MPSPSDSRRRRVSSSPLPVSSASSAVPSQALTALERRLIAGVRQWGPAVTRKLVLMVESADPGAPVRTSRAPHRSS